MDCSHSHRITIELGWRQNWFYVFILVLDRNAALAIIIFFEQSTAFVSNQENRRILRDDLLSHLEPSRRAGINPVEVFHRRIEVDVWLYDFDLRDDERRLPSIELRNSWPIAHIFAIILYLEEWAETHFALAYLKTRFILVHVHRGDIADAALVPNGDFWLHIVQRWILLVLNRFQGVQLIGNCRHRALALGQVVAFLLWFRLFGLLALLNLFWFFWLLFGLFGLLILVVFVSHILVLAYWNYAYFAGLPEHAVTAVFARRSSLFCHALRSLLATKFRVLSYFTSLVELRNF